MTTELLTVATDSEASSAQAQCPFPGPASYDYDGRSSFRGRNEEVRKLASKILGSRLTVLTAGSGDGKTSLIHAGIVPLLLGDGVEVSVVEPGGQAPIVEIATFCLDRLLPDTKQTAALVQRLANTLGSDRTLEDARTYCQEIPTLQRQTLLTGHPASRPVNLLEGGSLVTWLRDPQIHDDYLDAAAKAAAASSALEWPGTAAPLHAVLQFFNGIAPSEPAHLLGEPDETKHRLIAALDAAIARRCEADQDFELVLFLDQFEEIFVRFQDRTGAAAAGGNAPEITAAPRGDAWGHREAMLSFIREALKRPWPVRIVLSLRKEHYADLQATFGDVEELNAATYYLGPLTTRQAFECLTQPAAWPGAKPTAEQANAVIGVLSFEDRYVNPTLLSVVGEWLWRHPDAASLSVDDLRTAVPDAMGNLVRRAFGPIAGGGHGWTTLEQHEALDILEQLVIRSGSQKRRNSVAEDAVTGPPLRDPTLRKRILLGLESSRLVRKEKRLGGWYIEIVHERLIDVVQSFADELNSAMPALAELPILLDELRAESQDAMASRPLPNKLLRVLFANIERIELPPVLAARTFGRLLLVPDLLEIERIGGGWGESSATENREALRVVLRRLGEEAERETGVQQGKPEWRIAQGLLVSPAEAELLRAQPEGIRDRGMLGLIVASALVHRDKGAMDRIREFGRRLRQESLS